jgi:hypothetical protein
MEYPTPPTQSATSGGQTKRSSSSKPRSRSRKSAATLESGGGITQPAGTTMQNAQPQQRRSRSKTQPQQLQAAE